MAKRPAWKLQRTQAGSRQDTAVQTAGANTAREGLNPVPGTAYNESRPNAAEGLTVGESLTEGNGYASAGEMLGERAEGAGGAGSCVRDQLLNQVENPKLKNAVNEIYRPGATVGDGGLADAVRHELSTSELVGGKSHIQKATERVTNLENVINKQNLSSGDLEIAKNLLDDLKKALGGK